MDKESLTAAWEWEHKSGKTVLKPATANVFGLTFTFPAWSPGLHKPPQIPMTKHRRLGPTTRTRDVLALLGGRGLNISSKMRNGCFAHHSFYLPSLPMASPPSFQSSRTAY